MSSFIVNELVDMEWSFGVTAASTAPEQVGKTYLRVKLVLDRGGKRENVFMEMSLSQFYEFMHEMERAKAHLAAL